MSHKANAVYSELMGRFQKSDPTEQFNDKPQWHWPADAHVVNAAMACIPSSPKDDSSILPALYNLAGHLSANGISPDGIIDLAHGPYTGSDHIKYVINVRHKGFA